MDEWLKARILGVLERHHVMTLATIGPDGYPQATTVNYASIWSDSENIDRPDPTPAVHQ
jgi:hypothetical protein